MTDPDETFRRWADQAAAAAGDAPLDEALAGLSRIARAAGIFEATWQARSLTEVCEMLAAWCTARRPEVMPPSAGAVVEFRALQPVEPGADVEAIAGSGVVGPVRFGPRSGVAINYAPANGLVYVRLDPRPVT